MTTRKQIGSIQKARSQTILSHDDFLKMKSSKTNNSNVSITSSLEKPHHYAEWIGSFDWDHFVTFTTGYKMTLASARRAMKRVHSIYNTNTYGDPIIVGGMRMFWVAEPFDVKEGYHTHALTYYYDRELHLMSHMGVSQDFFELRRAWQQAVGTEVFGNKREWNYVTDQAEYKTGGARIDIQRYQKDLGANHYVAKYLFKHRADYGMFQS